MGKSIWVSHIGQYNGKFIAETTITLCVILVVSVYNYVNVNYIHDIIIKSFKKLYYGEKGGGVYYVFFIQEEDVKAKKKPNKTK